MSGNDGVRIHGGRRLRPSRVRRARRWLLPAPPHWQRVWRRGRWGGGGASPMKPISLVAFTARATAAHLRPQDPSTYTRVKYRHAIAHQQKRHEQRKRAHAARQVTRRNAR